MPGALPALATLPRRQRPVVRVLEGRCCDLGAHGGVLWHLAYGAALLLAAVFHWATDPAGNRLVESIVLLVFSLPFFIGLYSASIGMHWIYATLLIPVFFLYYYLGPTRFMTAGCSMLVLIGLSFTTGHALHPANPRPGDSEEQTTTGNPAACENTAMLMDRRPNVHVIMLDSFTHSAFTREFMGMENPAASYLASLDDAIYAGNRGFADAAGTRESWGVLFALGKACGVTSQGTFSGRESSPLTALLQSNDYYVQTGFSTSFFGKSKGAYVDHYLAAAATIRESSLICLAERYRSFLGLCAYLGTSLARRITPRLSIPEESERFDTAWRAHPDIPWREEVISRIVHAELNIEGPVFSGYHVCDPIGHVPPSYLYGDSRALQAYKQYFSGAVVRAHEFLQNINRLRKRFPDSIFIISGDHGPWLTKPLTRYSKEITARFWTLDRYAVALAMLNASNLCPWSRQWLEQQSYLTSSRMLVAALACNGQGRQLTQGFTDNEDFIRFGASLPARIH